MTKKACKRKKRPLSTISALHYFKLAYRSLLLIAAFVEYLFTRLENISGRFPLVLVIIWIVFAFEIVLRFFPSKHESMGCQKQFERNYKPIESPSGVIKGKIPGKITFLVFMSWILLNGIIAALYFAGVIDKGILILISLFYSVCDMICILFFCPFQTLMMKNRCCATCRIYNWDYAMMFTPLVLLIPNIFAASLFAMSFLLLLKWEITYKKYPERFYPSTNEGLSCENCREKLCAHKVQLKYFWRTEYQRLKRLKGKIIKSKKE